MANAGDSSDGRDDFLNFMKTELTLLSSFACESGLSQTSVDYLHTHLELLLSYSFQAFQVGYISNDLVNELVWLLNECKSIGNNIERSSLERVYSGRPGQPAYAISEDQLLFFVEANFKNTEIAAILNVSTRTIQRRMEEFGIQDVISRYTDIESDALDEQVRNIKVDFPHCGLRSLKGHLQSRGIRVTWENARCSLWRVDPRGIFSLLLLVLLVPQMSLDSRRNL